MSTALPAENGNGSNIQHKDAIGDNGGITCIWHNWDIPDGVPGDECGHGGVLEDTTGTVWQLGLHVLLDQLGCCNLLGRTICQE